MTTGITFSTFDLLHAGHVEMLKDAKSHCDFLIVGLQTDPTIDRKDKNKPVQTIVERYTQLKACKYVDEIIPYSTEDDLLDILALRMPQVRILGDEYIDKNFTGRKFCEDNSIQLVFNSRKHRFSTSSLRNDIFNTEHAKLLTTLEK